MPNGLTGTCLSLQVRLKQDPVTAVAGNLRLAFHQLRYRSQCDALRSFAVNVTGIALSAQSNTTGTVTSTEGGTNRNSVRQCHGDEANQTIAFGASTRNYGDAPVTVSATSDSGLTVTFASSTTTICTVAVATVTIKGAGTCTITASQAGNSSYNAAADGPQSFTVNKAALTVTADNATKGFNVALPTFTTSNT